MLNKFASELFLKCGAIVLVVTDNTSVGKNLFGGAFVSVSIYGKNRVIIFLTYTVS